jgi:zinc protease
VTYIAHRARATAAALLLSLVSTVTLAAQAPATPITLPKGVQFVRSAEGIDEYQLDNGMRVLFFQDESKASTSVVVTYLVGSRHEGYGETGMAHLLEHMLFKGTTRTPNVPAALTSRGMEYNASTSYDRTNYFESFDPDPEHLKFALEF